ncbi:MAG: ribokinase [Actinomycetota bacterium]|jgi:ribokinase
MSETPPVDDALWDVCVVGSSNLDLVATTQRLPQPGETVLGSGYAEHPGGKGLNQAVAAARAGARTAFVSAVGTDAAGDRLLDVMGADQIDSSHVTRPSAVTGRALIAVAADGENSIVVVPGANASVAGHPIPPARVVLAQLEVPIDAVIAAFRSARESGAVTVLNPSPAQQLPDELLMLCDLLVPNEHEADLLGGVEHLSSLGVTAVVVTAGSRGADVYRNAKCTHVDPFPVNAIDTTGAGDTFCGALCARLARGVDLVDALRFASAAAALSTTRVGAVPSIPTLDETEQLLSAGA